MQNLKIPLLALVLHAKHKDTFTCIGIACKTKIPLLALVLHAKHKRLCANIIFIYVTNNIEYLASQAWQVNQKYFNFN